MSTFVHTDMYLFVGSVSLSLLPGQFVPLLSPRRPAARHCRRLPTKNFFPLSPSFPSWPGDGDTSGKGSPTTERKKIIRNRSRYSSPPSLFCPLHCLTKGGRCVPCLTGRGWVSLASNVLSEGFNPLSDPALVRKGLPGRAVSGKMPVHAPMHFSPNIWAAPRTFCHLPFHHLARAWFGPDALYIIRTGVLSIVFHTVSC
ncbi:hypothetical protein LY78DRAFT_23653 [Colletotrichum sublineola]|nr:hypothetical protein LY78DRAFT_23653 [Colletotrichum sublineola]